MTSSGFEPATFQFVAQHLNQCANVVPYINILNTELNPICYLPALLGARHILHVSRIEVNAVQYEITGYSLQMQLSVSWRFLNNKYS